MDDHCAARFALVTAAHHFIAAALPLRDDSRGALCAFECAARAISVPAPDLDSVLLNALSILDRHTRGRLPTLVERYLSGRHAGAAPLARFVEIVREVLAIDSVRDPFVRMAISMIEASFADSRLTGKSIAERIDRRSTALAAAFVTETGLHPSEYLKQVRLHRAAALLSSSGKSVKEIWASVGYNHASNFDHDFKDHFGVSPREYRIRAVDIGRTPDRGRRSLRQIESELELADQTSQHSSREGRDSVGVLVVDDDAHTREIFTRYLTFEGYSVSSADSGEQCLVKAACVDPDAILLDYHLPDMDGLSCLRALRNQQRHARVLVFSADWDLEDRIGDFEECGAAFLSKLCDLEDVKCAIETALSRQHPSNRTEPRTS